MISKLTLFIFFLECKNSGKYSDAQCLGWKEYCNNTYMTFVKDHCGGTCGFCDTGIPNQGK